MDKIIIIVVQNQELGRIIAKMIFYQYGISCTLVDGSGLEGYSVTVDERYSEIDETLMGFADGVQAVLGRFFSL